MRPYEIRSLAHIVFAVLYGLMGYLTVFSESVPGFWRGIVHGFFWLPRLIFEMFMDFSIFVSPHSGGYTIAFILGVILAFVLHFFFYNIFLMIAQVITGRTI